MEHPAGLDNVSLSGRTGSFNETCGAIQQKLKLDPHSEMVVYVLLGCDDASEGVVKLAKKYSQPAICEEALQDVIDFWDKHLESNSSFDSIRPNQYPSKWMVVISITLLSNVGKDCLLPSGWGLWIP